MRDPSQILLRPVVSDLLHGAAGKHLGRVRFVPQPRPLGYGHAVYCAREAVNGEPFLHLVGDHLPVSCTPTACALRLAELAAAEECAVSAVQVTRENLLPRGYRYDIVDNQLKLIQEMRVPMADIKKIFYENAAGLVDNV